MNSERQWIFATMVWCCALAGTACSSDGDTGGLPDGAAPTDRGDCKGSGFQQIRDAGNAISINGVLASSYVERNMVCPYSGSSAQPIITSGVLDIALRSEYDATYLLSNEFSSFDVIEGAIVRITSKDNAPLRSYTRLTATSINPSTECSPGHGVVSLEVIDPDTILSDADIQALAAGPLGGPARVRLVTYVKLFGAVGGSSVSSSEFEFPVDLCNGCLITYSNDPASPTPNCVGGISRDASAQGRLAPCTVGQDLPIDCDLCLPATQCQGK